MFFKKILVPVDGSKHALLAKHKAAGIAVSMNAEIVLVNVTGGIPSIIGGHAREEIKEEMRVEAEKIFQQYIPEIEEHGVKYSTRITHGRPFDAICETAEEDGCDLICIGTRGLGEVEGMLLGSVTAVLIAHCKIPILVIR